MNGTPTSANTHRMPPGALADASQAAGSGTAPPIGWPMSWPMSPIGEPLGCGIIWGRLTAIAARCQVMAANIVV